MAFAFVDFFAVVGLGPSPIDPPVPEPGSSVNSPLANAASNRRRRASLTRSRGVQCVATSHFYLSDDAANPDDSPGFSELFGAPRPPAILDSYPLSKNRDEIADALPQFCFPTGLYLSRSGALPTNFRIVLTDVEGARMYATVLMFHDSVPCSALVSPSHPLASCSQMVYVPKCLTVISHWPFFDVFKQFLKFVYQASLTPSPLPLERFICNFVDEIPLPPAGRASVVFKLDQQELTLQRAPPNKIDIIDVDPRVVYLQLSYDVVIRVFSLLLLEQKVLMLSSRFTALSDVGDTLLSYLQPLTWEHVYIPILPTRLSEFLNAPTPFLMGCHVQVLEELQVPDDVALLFIDENRLELGGGRGHFATIPNLPDKYHKKILKRLAVAKAPVPQPSSSCIQLMEMAFPIVAPPSSEAEDSVPQVADELDMTSRAMIQDCFYQCLVSLLVRYKEFVIPAVPAATSRDKTDVARDTYSGVFTTDDHKAHMIENSNYNAATQFRWKECLAQHPSPFMQLFLATSIFSRFVEDRHDMSPERLLQIQLFDEHIICKQNRANVWFKKKQTPFISDSQYEVAKNEFAPPPSLAGIDPTKQFKYERFPALNPDWYIKKRLMHVVSDAQDLEWEDIERTAQLSSKSRSQMTKRMRELSFSSWIRVHCAIANVRSPVHVRDIGSAVFLVYEGMKRYSLRPHDTAVKAIVSMFGRVEDSDTLLHVLHAIKTNGITIEPFFYRVLPTAHSVLSPERSHESLDAVATGGAGVARSGSFIKKPLPPTPLPPSPVLPITSHATLLLGSLCPSCSVFISAGEIKSSWTTCATGAGWGYSTCCPKCQHSFVARFLVTVTGAEAWSGWVECVSPMVVHGEINSLLEELESADSSTVAATFLSNLRGGQASVFWNFIWHCADIKVGFEFILPGYSVQLASSRDSGANNNSAGIQAEEQAAPNAPSAASLSPASGIPTMSLVEFEQDSKSTRTQERMVHDELQSRSRSERMQAPSRPLPLPEATVKDPVAAPSKVLPPPPSDAAASVKEAETL